MIARLLARRDATIGVIAVLFAVQAVIRFAGHLSHDAAWYLYAARQLLGGAVLYRDIVEVNPPLGMWLSMPVVELADAAGMSAPVLLKLVLFLLTALVLALAARILDGVPGLARVSANGLLVLLAALLLFLPGFDFAQREHMLIVLATPWLLMRWRRVAGGASSAGFALLVGAMAAIGFWLKPHCGIGAVAVELAVLALRRDLRLTFAVENLAAIALSILYIAAVWFLAHGFFSDMVTLGREAYVPFYGYGFGKLASRMVLPVLAGLVALAGVGGLLPPLRPLAILLLSAGVGFLAAYSLQAGYRYQLMPGLFTLVLAAGVMLLPRGAGGVLTSFRQRLVPIAAGLVGLLVMINLIDKQYWTYYGGTFDQAMQRVAPGSRSFFVASTNVYNGFPLAEEKRLVWASRFPALWLAPYAAATLAPDGGPGSAIGRYALDATVSDLIRFRPEVVFVNEGDQTYFKGPPLDYIAFWKHDPRFADLWSGYEAKGTSDGFAIFVRRDRTLPAG